MQENSILPEDKTVPIPSEIINLYSPGIRYAVYLVCIAPLLYLIFLAWSRADWLPSANLGFTGLYVGFTFLLVLITYSLFSKTEEALRKSDKAIRLAQQSIAENRGHALLQYQPFLDVFFSIKGDILQVFMRNLGPDGSVACDGSLRIFFLNENPENPRLVAQYDIPRSFASGDSYPERGPLDSETLRNGIEVDLDREIRVGALLDGLLLRKSPDPCNLLFQTTYYSAFDDEIISSKVLVLRKNETALAGTQKYLIVNRPSWPIIRPDILKLGKNMKERTASVLEPCDKDGRFKFHMCANYETFVRSFSGF